VTAPDPDLLFPLIKGKVKVKLSLCLTKHHTVKTYWVSGCTAPCILKLGTTWRRVVSFTPRPLYPRGRALGTHYRWGWIGCRGSLDSMTKRKNLIIEPRSSSTSLVSILAVLSWIFSSACTNIYLGSVKVETKFRIIYLNKRIKKSGALSSSYCSLSKMVYRKKETASNF